MMDVQAVQREGSTDEEEKVRTPSGSGGGSSTKSKLKSRRELPAGAVVTLKAWLLSPEHFTHPYPTPQEQHMLMEQTGIDKKQLKTWFTNARRRIWKPLLKKQLNLGKNSQAGGSGNVVIMPATTRINTSPGLASVNTNNSQTEQQNYQQTLHQPTQQQSNDQYANPIYECIPQQNQNSFNSDSPSYYEQGHSTSKQQNDDTPRTSQCRSDVPPMPMSTPGAITSSSSSASSTSMNKIDSRALLNELFERELMNQDIGQNKYDHQYPTNSKIEGGTSTVDKQGTGIVPSMDSWPHFSSVSSLNNLSTMTGVKSITKICTTSGSASASGADLVGQGSKGLNKEGKGNMGRADSFAFLNGIIF